MRRTLARMTALIVAACDPEGVYLFGSHARGAGRADSDVDLLVVVGAGRWTAALRQELAELIARLAVRSDVHVFSATDLSRAAQSPLDFPGSVLAGMVRLYPVAEPGIDRPANARHTEAIGRT